MLTILTLSAGDVPSNQCAPPADAAGFSDFPRLSSEQIRAADYIFYTDPQGAITALRTPEGVPGEMPDYRDLFLPLPTPPGR